MKDEFKKTRKARGREHMLNIRFIGKPTPEGTIKPVHNVRGARKNISKIVEEMLNMGYKGGKVWIY